MDSRSFANGNGQSVANGPVSPWRDCPQARPVTSWDLTIGRPPE
jgi:hypothetical protein